MKLIMTPTSKLTDDLVVGDMFPISNCMFKITRITEWMRTVDLELELVADQGPTKPSVREAKVSLPKNMVIVTYL